MYKKLMDLKFSRLPTGLIASLPLLEKVLAVFKNPSTRQTYIHAHVYRAFELMFPDRVEEFKPILQGYNKVDESILYTIGLLEKGDRGPFIHQTFAEFMIAEFIANNLEKYIACTDLLFTDILGSPGTKNIFNQRYLLKNPALAYFIEKHISGSKKKMRLSNKFDLEDVCKAVRTCSTNNLERLCECAINVLQLYCIDEQSKETYIRDLPHKVVEDSTKVSILEQVFKFTRNKLELHLSYHTIPNNFINTIIPRYTPLHVAVFYGKLNFVIYLVNEQYGKEQVRQLDHLMFLCLYSSDENSDSVIEQKKAILDKLLKINPDWIVERDFRGCTPLLYSNVHLSLLKHLVEEHNADINSYDTNRGTVLHSSNPYKLSFSDLSNWAFSNGFNLIDYEDKNGRTPLMNALEEFGTIDNEVLLMFQERNVNFNAEDVDGNSVLFYALEYSGKLETIQKLHEYGAKLNHKNGKSQNALHVLLKGRKSIEERLKVIDMLVERNPDMMNEEDRDDCTPLLLPDELHGTVLHKAYARSELVAALRWTFQNQFNRINFTDNMGRTPLMYAIEKLGSLSDDAIQMFHQAGADFNAKDNDGDSVFFYALASSDSVDFLTTILEYHIDVDHINRFGQNAAHKLMEGGLDPCQIIAIKKLLASKGFDKFDETFNGYTPDQWRQQYSKVASINDAKCKSDMDNVLRCADLRLRKHALTKVLGPERLEEIYLGLFTD